jgi:hypothetical protein
MVRYVYPIPRARASSAQHPVPIRAAEYRQYHNIRPALVHNHHIVQDLDVAFSFRHLTSIRVEEERQMSVFWRGERQRSIKIEVQRK